MKKIANPKKISYQASSDPNQGVVTIEPLFPGYGMTLGNSLRRVLLSSLPGAAVTSVKIKGASHEFMTLAHIQEDVLEILLNFKELRMKIFSDEEEDIRLELKVSGKKTVTAADIKKDSRLEIKNPKLVLAKITDPKGSLEVEIIVNSGRGYKIAEGNNENKEVGFLEIDSIFSPVSLVSLKVENTRVGKMTNWDKLSLDIKTDGTLSPEDAYKAAVDILVDQYQALMPGAEADDSQEKEEGEEETEKEAKKPAPKTAKKATKAKAEDKKTTSKTSKK